MGESGTGESNFPITHENEVLGVPKSFQKLPRENEMWRKALFA